MKKKYKLIWVAISIMVIANIPPVTGLFHFFLDGNVYRYSNADGTFTFHEFWDRNYDMMQRVHQFSLQKNPAKKINSSIGYSVKTH